ncbi:MAG TPA: hypothetical protein VFZ34_17830 [Blastocatellia bacterium]|nr:hypothetical protein [Blastocatellia bacterium]
MTNTTARPASMGNKRGIPLSEKLFAKAITKAREVNPRVVAIGSYYGVMQSDQHTMATVHFVAWDGAIYASCTCKAHTIGDNGKPVPCYHIAAAALHKGAASVSADVPRLVETQHHHSCPRCGDSYDCNCPSPELGDAICQDCDVDAFDAEQQRHNEAIEHEELQAEILRRWEQHYPHNSLPLLRNALAKRFGVNALHLLPMHTLQQICDVL